MNEYANAFKYVALDLSFVCFFPSTLFNMGKLRAPAMIVRLPFLLVVLTYVCLPVFCIEMELKPVVNPSPLDRGLAARQNRPCKPTEPLCVNAHALLYMNKLRLANKVKPLKMGSVQMTKDAIEHSKNMSAANKLITSDLMKINDAHWYKCGEFLAGEFVAKHRLPPPAHMDTRKVVPEPDYTSICMKPWTNSPKHLDAMTYDRIDDVSLGVLVDKEKNVIWCTLLLAVNTYPTCKRAVWNAIGAGPDTGVVGVGGVVAKNTKTPTSTSSGGGLGVAALNNTGVAKPEANPFATASASPSVSRSPMVEVKYDDYKFEYNKVLVQYRDGVEQEVKVNCFGENCRYCIADKSWCYSMAFSVLVDTYLKHVIGKPKLF